MILVHSLTYLGAERMGDVFDRIAKRMGVIVGRIYAPFVPSPEKITSQKIQTKWERKQVSRGKKARGHYETRWWSYFESVSSNRQSR